MSAGQTGAIERLLVVVPNWVGDVVLASPVLAALRAHFRTATIAYLLRGYVREIVEGGGWHDELILWPAGAGVRRNWRTLALAAELRRRRFDCALLLTNSFRSALVTRLAGIPRRVGYARDGRRWLLTDRLEAQRRNGAFVPSPVLPYYARLAEHLGCAVVDRRARLGVTPAQEEAGQALLQRYGLHEGTPYAVVNPGAAYGAAKCWLPERFAELCDRLPTEFGLRPVLVGNPGTEGGLMRRIAELARGPVICCLDPPTTLGTLKVLVREARLLVCNDTGPRHYGHAFGIPTVTIFGPTHQAWTDTDYAGEIKLQVPVECGPCQLKICPLDHRCMTGLTTDRVMRAVAEVLQRHRADHSPATRLVCSGSLRPCADALGRATS